MAVINPNQKRDYTFGYNGIAVCLKSELSILQSTLQPDPALATLYKILVSLGRLVRKWKILSKVYDILIDLL